MVKDEWNILLLKEKVELMNIVSDSVLEDHLGGL